MPCILPSIYFALITDITYPTGNCGLKRKRPQIDMSSLSLGDAIDVDEWTNSLPFNNLAGHRDTHLCKLLFFIYNKCEILL